MLESGAIFEGRSVGYRRTDDFYLEYQFQVSRIWKGEVSETLTVRTFPPGGLCGYEFEAGKAYLVFAGRYDGVLSTSICTRTQEIGRGSDEDDLPGTIHPYEGADDVERLDQVRPETLARQLKSRKKAVRLQGLFALAERPDALDAAVPALRKMPRRWPRSASTSDPPSNSSKSNSARRIRALEGLGALGPAAIGLQGEIETLLDDEKAWVAKAAAEALAKVRGEVPSPKVEDDRVQKSSTEKSSAENDVEFGPLPPPSTEWTPSASDTLDETVSTLASLGPGYRLGRSR